MWFFIASSTTFILGFFLGACFRINKDKNEYE